MISVSRRFGTGQLCQGYIRLLTSLLDQLDLTVFSLPSLLLSLLLRRLLLLAGPQAAPQQTSPWLSVLVPQLSARPPRPQDLASLDTPRLVRALTSAHNAALDLQPLLTAVLETGPGPLHPRPRPHLQPHALLPKSFRPPALRPPGLPARPPPAGAGALLRLPGGGSPHEAVPPPQARLLAPVPAPLPHHHGQEPLFR